VYVHSCAVIDEIDDYERMPRTQVCCLILQEDMEFPDRRPNRASGAVVRPSPVRN
jgi:hypothetical protein